MPRSVFLATPDLRVPDESCRQASICGLGEAALAPTLKNNKSQSALALAVTATVTRPDSAQLLPERIAIVSWSFVLAVCVRA
jgi:hypothetical protein